MTDFVTLVMRTIGYTFNLQEDFVDHLKEGYDLKTFCGLALWLLLSIGQLVAQAAQPADKSMLIALENAWNQAQIHHDGKALNELVADTFIYTDWDGTLLNKAKFIADAKDSSTQISSAANNDVEVYFYPGVAVVAGVYHTKGVSEGKSFDHRGRFTDTWILSKNEWKCVASHTNLIKK